MGAMPGGLDIRIEGFRLLGRGEPQGLPLDRQDAPQLVREIDTLCSELRCARPGQTVFTTEFSLRLYRPKGWFGKLRRRTLALGWPLLQILDADELRVALAMALLGESVTTGESASGTADTRLADHFGVPLMVRTLTRLLTAELMGAEHWLSELNGAACVEPLPPAQALNQVRESLQACGRGRWQPTLDRLLRGRGPGARILALGAAQLDGGSHRSAASALIWEGMAGRLWTALEAPFVELLMPIWQARHKAQQLARARVRELELRRSEGSIEGPELIELARSVEQLAGARAAYPLYRQAYAHERSPRLALALARTMVAIDLPRARIALAHLAASSHALAPEAEQLLRSLPDVACQAEAQAST